MSVRERPSPPSALVFGPSHQEAALPPGARPIRVRDPYYQPQNGEEPPERLVGAESDRCVHFWRKQERRYFTVTKVELARTLPDQDLLRLLLLRAEAAGLPLDDYLERLATLSR